MAWNTGRYCATSSCNYLSLHLWCKKKEENKKEAGRIRTDMRYNILDFNPLGHDFWFPYSRMLSQIRAPVTQRGWLNWITHGCPSYPGCPMVKRKVQSNKVSSKISSKFRSVYIHLLKLKRKGHSQKFSCHYSWSETPAYSPGKLYAATTESQFYFKKTLY